MIQVINERYQIIQRIGTGGMADVFLCKDLVIDRDVALKRLRGDLSNDPVALLRFQREANAASGLHHPNIVEVYDVGDDQGQPYIVMEYVKGVTAKELVHRRGALDKHEALSIMKQLVSAVNCAHEAGIVHRDIKPQNILVKDDGTVKIADFGIALANDALQLTKVDSVMGSVHYLAPECVRGDGATIQSDIYAMGIVFYELITGNLPFSGETPIEIAMKHLKETLPSVLKYNADIPHSFANIIFKATQKNQNHRYFSSRELLEDITSALDADRLHETLWILDDYDDNETLMFSTINDQEDRSWSTKKKLFVSLGVVGLVGIVFGLWVLFGPKQAEPYYLDNLVGLTVDDAKQLLAEHNIYIHDTLSYDFSEEYEQGYIIETKPASGTQVLPGSQIRVTVSQGKMFEIEDYTGMKFSEVQELLSDNTNITIQRKNVASKDVEPGIVIGQEGLTPGQRVNPNQKVVLVLQVSSEPDLIVPDLRSKPIAEAQKTLEELGAVVSLNRLSMAGMSPDRINSLTFGVVIEQNPFAGSYYVQLEGSSIVLSYYDESDVPNIPSQETEDETP